MTRKLDGALCNALISAVSRQTLPISRFIANCTSRSASLGGGSHAKHGRFSHFAALTTAPTVYAHPYARTPAGCSDIKAHARFISLYIAPARESSVRICCGKESVYLCARNFALARCFLPTYSQNWPGR